MLHEFAMYDKTCMEKKIWLQKIPLKYFLVALVVFLIFSLLMEQIHLCDTRK